MKMQQIHNATPLIFDNYGMVSRPQVSILLTHSYASFDKKLHGSWFISEKVAS